MFIKEFKEFAVRGNVFDMAVGIVMGASFGKIISSLVNDVLMPPIGAIVGNVDFSNLAISLGDTVKIRYGVFINTLIDFTIVAFAMFIVIKQVNRLQKKKPADPTTKPCPYCVSNIALQASRCPQCTSQLA